MTKKEVIKNIFKVGVSITLIFLLLKRIGVNQLANDLKNIEINYLLVAVFFTLLGFFVQVARLQVIISSQKIKISFWKVFVFNLVSTFFGIFLPTIIGGDVVKMAFLGIYSGKKATSAGVVTMDRVIGTYALVAVALIAGILGSRLLTHDIVLYTIYAFVGAFIALLILNIKPLWNKIWYFLEKKLKLKLGGFRIFVETLQSYKVTEPTFIKGFLLSIFFYVSIIVSNYFVSLALGLNVNLVAFFVFVPLLSLASMLPISISGIGVRESVSVIFFSTMGVSSSNGVLLSLIPFAIKAIMGLIGGVIYPFTGLTKEVKQ